MSELSNRNEWSLERRTDNLARVNQDNIADTSGPLLQDPFRDYNPYRPDRSAWEVASFVRSETSDGKPITGIEHLGATALGVKMITGEYDLSNPSEGANAGAAIDGFVREREKNVNESSERIFDIYTQATTKMKERLQLAVSSDQLGEELLERLDTAISSTGIQAADKMFMGGFEGSYNQHFNYIRLSHEISPDLGEQVVVHELVHQISGGTFRESHSLGKIERSRTGFSERLKSKPGEERHRALNEALTQHITESLLYGEFDVIDPTKRENADIHTELAYVEYRERLAEIIDQSDGKLTVRMFINAYFEDNGDVPKTSERRKLINALVKVFGVGASRKLSQYLEEDDPQARRNLLTSE